MQIKVKESTMVRPAEATPRTTLWLSSVDAVFPSTLHVGIAYFYRPNGAVNFFDPMVLKDTLSRAMVPFYPVAGRLKKNNEGRLEIDCNGEGVLFVVAECDEEMDELEDFMPTSDFRLFPLVDYSRGLSTYPLFLVQVTYFKCGGVCLGTGNNHVLFDGTSVMHFMNTWSDIARGLGVTLPPLLDRTILSARNPPQPKFSHVEYQPPPTMKYPQNNQDVSKTIYSLFKLTKAQLNTLKAKSNKGNASIAYSTYEALAGHVWRCVSISRQLPDDQETKAHIIVDGRSRLRPMIPPNYFGNVIFNATPIALAGDLKSNPISFSTTKVHAAIAQMDNEYLRSAIDYLELQTDLSAISQGLYCCSSPNLDIISRATLPFYDADFGWGRPFYAGPGRNVPEGRNFILQSFSNDGSILLASWLPREQMKRFGELLYDV